MRKLDTKLLKSFGRQARLVRTFAVTHFPLLNQRNLHISSYIIITLSHKHQFTYNIIHTYTVHIYIHSGIAIIILEWCVLPLVPIASLSALEASFSLGNGFPT